MRLAILMPPCFEFCYYSETGTRCDRLIEEIPARLYHVSNAMRKPAFREEDNIDKKA